MGPQDMRLGDMDWIALASDKDSWRALVNVMMKLRVSYTARNFLTSQDPLSSQILCFMELVSCLYLKS